MSKTKGAKTVEITRHDIACEAASMVYRIITNVLHRCRDAAKLQMFHEVLYLFTSWSQLQSTIDQTSLQIKWKEVGSKSVDYVKTVPSTKEVKVQERYNLHAVKFEGADNENLAALKSFMKEHPEMCLIAEHDVSVSGKIRCLRCNIHIIEVVSKLVSAFCNIDSNSTATKGLCVDKSSLKVVAVISIALKDIIERTRLDVSEDNVVLWANMKTGKKKNTTGRTTAVDDCSRNSYSFPEVNGVSLAMFQPSPSRQKDTLWPMCLNLKEAEYLSKNRPMCSTSETQAEDFGVEDILDESGRGIEADDTIAVFRFS